MNFWSQFFPERSARKNGLYLFLAFRVHFREGGIDDSEQKCPAVDRFCLPLSLLIKHSIVCYWLKHVLSANSISNYH